MAEGQEDVRKAELLDSQGTPKSMRMEKRASYKSEERRVKRLDDGAEIEAGESVVT